MVRITGSSSETREDTILDSSKEIASLLDDLQGRLDSRFRKGWVRMDKPALPSTYSNVLDEIIARLQENKHYLSRIISFISEDVLPKID